MSAWRGLAVSLLGLLLMAAPPVRADAYFLTVAGLGGDPDYEARFIQEARQIDRVLKAGGSTVHVETLYGNEATRGHLIAALKRIAGQARRGDDFVLILIGHGTYDGVQYKLNLPGPDITAEALARLCDRIPSRHQLIVNTTEASGGSVAALVAPTRAVIAATKNGNEKNATVFARYFADALQDPAADLDKNDAISALEAFEYATAKTAAFYASQKLLATEHAVFADRGHLPAVRVASTATGDGRMLARFTLVRMGADREVASNPARRALLARKEQLEERIDTLKVQKAALSPEEYRQQLLQALVALAKVQEALDQ